MHNWKSTSLCLFFGKLSQRSDLIEANTFMKIYMYMRPIRLWTYCKAVCWLRIKFGKKFLWFFFFSSCFTITTWFLSLLTDFSHTHNTYLQIPIRPYIYMYDYVNGENHRYSGWVFFSLCFFYILFKKICWNSNSATSLPASPDFSLGFWILFLHSQSIFPFTP